MDVHESHNQVKRLMNGENGYFHRKNIDFMDRVATPTSNSSVQ